MSAMPDLERRIQALEDVEAIKKLKARYWYAVDTRQWDELATCFAGDAVFDVPRLGRMEGGALIVKVLKRAMRNVTTAHQGHNPEIEVTGDATARGRWALNDRVRLPDGGSLNGCGHYDEEYVKENGSWKIRKSRLTYVFQEASPAKADGVAAS